MSKKKVLFFINSLQRWGWAEKVIVDLWRALSITHDLSYLTIFASEEEHNVFFAKKYSCDTNLSSLENMNIFQKIYISIKIAWSVSQIVKNQKIDILVVHLVGASYIAIFSKLFWNRAKVIYVVHSALEVRSLWIWNRVFTYCFFRFFDKIITISDYIFHEFHHSYKLNNLQRIYNPISLKDIWERSKSEQVLNWYGISDADTVFLNIGRLVKEKGQIYLIEAFSKIADTIPTARLIIVWEWKLRWTLEERVEELWLQDNILFFGNIDNVYPFIQRADYFLVSSLIEWLPTVILEALALSKTIISTDCEWWWAREILCPELIEKGDITYPYYGKYGILSQAFCMQTDNSKAIEVYAETILKTIQEDILYTQWKSRAKDFDIWSIVQKWKQIL